MFIEAGGKVTPLPVHEMFGLNILYPENITAGNGVIADGRQNSRHQPGYIDVDIDGIAKVTPAGISTSTTAVHYPGGDRGSGQSMRMRQLT